MYIDPPFRDGPPVGCVASGVVQLSATLVGILRHPVVFARLFLALQLCAGGRTRRARKLAKGIAHRRYPESFSCLAALVEVEGSDAARGFLIQQAHLPEPNPTAIQFLAELRCKEGKLEEALGLYEALEETFPWQPRYRWSMRTAWLKAKLERYADAIDHCELALLAARCPEEHVYTHAFLARLYVRIGDEAAVQRELQLCKTIQGNRQEDAHLSQEGGDEESRGPSAPTD